MGNDPYSIRFVFRISWQVTRVDIGEVDALDSVLILLTAAEKGGNIAADSRHFVPFLVDMQNQVLLDYILPWKLTYPLKLMVWRRSHNNDPVQTQHFEHW